MSWEGWQDWSMDVDNDADQGAAEITVGMANLQRDWVYTPMPILIDTVQTAKGKGKQGDMGKGTGKVNIKGKFPVDKGKAKGKEKGKEKCMVLAVVPEGGQVSSTRQEGRQGAHAAGLHAVRPEV